MVGAVPLVVAGTVVLPMHIPELVLQNSVPSLAVHITVGDLHVRTTYLRPGVAWLPELSMTL